MKTKFLALGVLLALGLSARGAVFTYEGPFNNNGGAGDGVIPDNSSIGLSDSLTVSGLDFSITSVILTVTLQYGAATDLSGYLRLGDLVDSPFYDLTTVVQGQDLSGGSAVTFTVDVTASFTADNPNDTWTLFLADSVPGDQTTLNSWSLAITAVPEPTTWALIGFGGLFAGAGTVRWWRSRAIAECHTRRG